MGVTIDARLGCVQQSVQPLGQAQELVSVASLLCIEVFARQCVRQARRTNFGSLDRDLSCRHSPSDEAKLSDSSGVRMACAGVINGVRIEPTSNSPNSVHSMMRTEFPLQHARDSVLNSCAMRCNAPCVIGSTTPSVRRWCPLPRRRPLHANASRETGTATPPPTPPACQAGTGAPPVFLPAS